MPYDITPTRPQYAIPPPPPPPTKKQKKALQWESAPASVKLVLFCVLSARAQCNTLSTSTATTCASWGGTAQLASQRRAIPSSPPPPPPPPPTPPPPPPHPPPLGWFLRSFTTTTTPAWPWMAIFYWTGQGPKLGRIWAQSRSLPMVQPSFPVHRMPTAYNTGHNCASTTINYFDWCPRPQSHWKRIRFGDSLVAGPVSLPDPNSWRPSAAWYGGSAYLETECRPSASVG